MADVVEGARLNVEAVDFDDPAQEEAFEEAWIAIGMEKVREDFRRLREMGIVDEEGRQLKTDLPPDMLDDSADFGG